MAPIGYDPQPKGIIRTTPPAEALRALGFDSSFVNASIPADITAAAKAAQVAVVFIGRAGSEGESGGWCTERECGDTPDMVLDPAQRALLTAVLASKTPTVVVLFNCTPLDITDLLETGSGVHALVHAYYPQLWAGTAVADVLSGAFPPAGRMSYSWPKNTKDSGNLSDYKMTGTSKTYRYSQPDKQSQLFPFGFVSTVLQYTTIMSM